RNKRRADVESSGAAQRPDARGGAQSVRFDVGRPELQVGEHGAGAVQIVLGQGTQEVAVAYAGEDGQGDAVHDVAADQVEQSRILVHTHHDIAVQRRIFAGVAAAIGQGAVA